MGDIGEYWRDHKEHKRRKQGAEMLGMSMGEYAKWERQCEKEEAARKKQERFDKCTLQCECGKWLVDTQAHNMHKSKFGRKGHGVKATKEAKPPEEISFDVAF